MKSPIAERVPPPPANGAGLLRRSIWRQRGPLVAGYLLITCWQVGEALVPVLLGVILDRGIATSRVQPFLWGCLALACLFLAFSLSYRFGGRLVFTAMQEEEHQLRVETAAHVLHPEGARTGLLPGETLSLATSDAEWVAATLRNVGYFVSSGLAVVVACVLLVRIDGGLALAVFIGVPVSVALTQLLTPLISRRTDRQMASIARASGLAADFVAGLRPLKGAGGEDVAVSRYRVASQEAAGASIVAARANGYMIGLATGLSTLLLATIALIAGRAALLQSITIGEFISVVGLAAFLSEPIRTLGVLGAQFGSSLASAGRIATYLRTPRLAQVGLDDLPTGAGTPVLQFADVTTGALAGFSLTTRPGELLAVAIDDPAASDVVVDLIRGERSAQEGVVWLGGRDLLSLTSASRRAAVLVAQHGVDLFEGTLRSNIDPDGRLSVDRWEAVLVASAADDVAALRSEGLDQEVTPRGSTLSGGQRQRVALARSLAAQSPVLVLQDPTTAVDAVTEQRIATRLHGIRHDDGSNCTTVVLTTSPAWLDVADRVLLVQSGRVVGEGTHRDLLARTDYREAVTR